MKRRGFLGMLAALPALLMPRKAPAESAIDIAKRYTIVEETVEDWTDYDALADRLSGVTSYHVGMDVGRPGGDETAVTVWQRGDGRFTDTHAWYLKDDVCIGDPVTGCCIAHGSACSNVNVIRTFYRSRLHEDDLLPHRLRSKIEESWPTLRIPPKRAELPDLSKYFASKDTWWPLP